MRRRRLCPWARARHVFSISRALMRPTTPSSWHNPGPLPAAFQANSREDFMPPSGKPRQHAPSVGASAGLPSISPSMTTVVSAPARSRPDRGHGRGLQFRQPHNVILGLLAIKRRLIHRGHPDGERNPRWRRISPRRGDWEASTSILPCYWKPLPRQVLMAKPAPQIVTLYQCGYNERRWTTLRP